jgi:hypothetical protein
MSRRVLANDGHVEICYACDTRERAVKPELLQVKLWSHVRASQEANSRLQGTCVQPKLDKAVQETWP